MPPCERTCCGRVNHNTSHPVAKLSNAKSSHSIQGGNHRVTPLRYNSAMVWIVIAIVALFACVLLGAGCAYLYAQRSSLQRELAQTTDQRDEALTQVTTYREELGSLQNALAESKQQLALASQKQADFEQRIGDLRNQYAEAQKQARETFQAVAADVVDKANKRFLELAGQTFDGKQKQASAELDKRKTAIESLLKPIRETLDRHAKAVTDVEKQREGAYAAMRQQLGLLAEDQRRLQSETANLVKALRRPDVRGRWGEMQLRRVAELAGMIEHCDFTEQTSVTNSDGQRLRPDMIVHLPSQRQIVIDAKTPIDAYLSAIEADDQQQRDEHMTRHVRHIKEQVGNLAAKTYQAQFDRTPDFVILFIPGEPFLEAAVRRDAALIEDAMTKGVVIATPTTLVSLLKAVALGWREEQLAEHARQIAELGRELHERIATVTDHVNSVGKSLDSAVGHYNKMVGSLESRVMVTARKFDELGAGSNKTLPQQGEVKIVDTQPRQLDGT